MLLLCASSLLLLLFLFCYVNLVLILLRCKSCCCCCLCCCRCLWHLISPFLFVVGTWHCRLRLHLHQPSQLSLLSFIQSLLLLLFVLLLPLLLLLLLLRPFSVAAVAAAAVVAGGRRCLCLKCFKDTNKNINKEIKRESRSIKYAAVAAAA